MVSSNSRTSPPLVILQAGVPHGGFTWIEGPDRQRDSEPSGIGDGNNSLWLAPASPTVRWRSYRPLEKEPALFRIFADLESTPEGILKFANQYGWLGGRGTEAGTEADKRSGSKTPPPGESIETWHREIAVMRLCVLLWDAYCEGDISVLASELETLAPAQISTAPHPFTDEITPRRKTAAPGDEASPRGVTPTAHTRVVSLNPLLMDVARFNPLELGLMNVGVDPENVVAPSDPPAHAIRFIRSQMSHRLSQHACPAVLESDPATPLTLHIVAQNLLGGLWLQFALAIEGNKDYKHCAGCGQWFEATAGASGKRGDTQYCSTRCRVRAYRERKRRAVDLAEDGMSSLDMAQKLGSDLRAVKEWVGDVAKKPRAPKPETKTRSRKK